MAATRGANTPPGPGIDASGQSVVDPSTNVRALNDASVRRLDDVAELRAEMGQRDNEALRREMVLRSRYEEKLAKKESERLDAIRQRDNEQVANTAEVQRAVATTLASTVDRSAEAMRSSQAQAEAKSASTLDAKINPILSSIGDLQRFQFEWQGQKTQVVETRGAAEDMRPMVDAIERLTAAQNLSLGGHAQVVETRAKSSNVNLWIGLGIAAFVGAVGLFGTLISLAVAAFMFTR